MAFIAPLVASATAATAATATAASATAATTAAVAGSTAAAAAATTPAWLGYASLGLTALGGVTGTLGALQAGQASAASAKYNAAVANVNAEQAKRNSELASQAGMEQAAMQERKTRAEVGAIRANQAAAGIDVNSGSALDVRSSAAELGELDALTVRSNATKEAYGYQTQESSFKSQAGLDTTEASNDLTAGYTNAASTFLGAAGTGASNFAKYQLQGGFSA
jgi:hypothetical protein